MPKGYAPAPPPKRLVPPGAGAPLSAPKAPVPLVDATPNNPDPLVDATPKPNPLVDGTPKP